EYNELKTGNRSEAIITSLRPFLTKMSTAIVVAITSATYLIFKVTKYTNRISDFENQAARNVITEAQKLQSIDQIIANVQSSQTTGLLLSMTLIPFALMLISYILYKKKYKLDEGEYERICRELDKKRETAR
ncbi:MAG: hypothetical protein SO135_06715, partial [Sphaerochaetaceae bacterium]|nr:hypothetical protein [Sphaerochaetaceae bacterium]